MNHELLPLAQEIDHQTDPAPDIALGGLSQLFVDSTAAAIARTELVGSDKNGDICAFASAVQVSSTGTDAV